MSQDTPSPSDYLFAQATDEARRLKRQSEFFHRFTSAFLESANITTGMKVLDVGTGIGEVAFMLAERVGQPAGAADQDAPVGLRHQRRRGQGTADEILGARRPRQRGEAEQECDNKPFHLRHRFRKLGAPLSPDLA